MASGIINLTSNGIENLYGRISWESVADSSSNTSTLTLNYQFRRDTSTGATASHYIVTTTLWDESKDDGYGGGRLDTFEYETTYKEYFYNTSWHDTDNVTTSTHTITHNDDGTASFTVHCTIAAVDIGGIFECSQDITLDTISRKATITAASNFTDSDNPTIRYSNPAGSSVDSLQAAIFDTTGYTAYADYRDVSKTGTSYTFTLTTSERNKLIAAVGNGTSMSVRFYLRTIINGTSSLSSSTKTFSINVDGPTITATIADANTTTVALTGGGTKFIPGNNSMSYSMTATGQKGATISSYSVICGSQQKTTASGTLTNIENSVVIFSATDSRGMTSTKTIQLDAVDYIKPTCNQTVRMILDGESSAQMSLTISGNFFNGSFGSKSNTLSLYVRHGRNGETMGDWVDLSPLGYLYDGNTYTLSTNMSGFDPSGDYTFQCKAVDALNTATTGEYTVAFLPVFDWSKNDFNFNVPVTIEGYALADYVVEYGTEAMGTNGTWYWRKWKSGRADCYGVRNYGNMAVTTAWGGLYRSESFSQSLPSGLFIDTPEVIDVNYRVSNYGGWIAQHEATAPSSSNTGGFIVVRPASTTLNSAHISFNVIGRWY